MIPSTCTRRSLLARSCTLAALCLGGLAAPPAHSQAAAYPTQTVKLIVPTAPGAGMDTGTRLLAEKLSKAWGKPVVVENKPGGNYLVGYNAFRAAKGDPHTLLMADIGFISIQPHIPAPEAVEPRTALKPITDLFYTSFVLLARPDRFGSLADLLSAAQDKPGALNYGASGTASGQRLSVELLKAQTGRNLTFIPYAGNAPALTALLAGDVDLVSIGLPPSKSFIDAGKLKALAVSSTDRSSVLPQVPTVDEAAGIRGYSADSWVGIFGPPGMPEAMAAAVQREVAAALQSPEMMAFFRTNDYAAGGNPGAAFAQRAERDREKYRKLIADMKLTFN